MAKIKEIWKAIPGYEDKYEASYSGKIRSLTRKLNSCHQDGRIMVGRILRSHTSKSTGYVMVSVGGKNSKTIHRLVALTWIPNPENKPCVNHLDGDKENNAVPNLAWATYSENETHSYRVLGKKPVLNGLGRRPPNARKVKQFKDGKLIKIYETASQAAKVLGTHQGTISEVCRGEKGSWFGLKFKYA